MMKQIVLSLFLLISVTVEAQQLRVGPTVGAQLSRPHYDNTDFYNGFTPKRSLGFKAGGVVDVKASDYFALHTELVYSRVSKHIDGLDGYTVNREQYNYLSMPLLLRGSLPLGELEVYVNAGPSVSYWLGGHTFLRHTELIEREIFELDHRIGFHGETSEEYGGGMIYVSQPNRIQLSLDMGTGMMIPMGGRYLMVDLRYSWGHTNMAKPDTEYIDLFLYDDNLSFANHSFSVSLAYQIELDLVKLTRKGKTTVTKKKGVSKNKGD